MKEFVETDPTITDRHPLVPQWIEMLDDEDTTAMDFLRLAEEHQAR